MSKLSDQAPLLGEQTNMSALEHDISPSQRRRPLFRTVIGHGLLLFCGAALAHNIWSRFHAPPPSPEQLAEKVLSASPVIDGHIGRHDVIGAANIVD
ncbi:hypothetical protein EIP86_004675 [Pleurotus ostreatoroseus]|nr:hypothetical protein EIP86_004675 [Pleurotus ostreatoroseus]